MGYKYTANGNLSSIYDEYNALPRVYRFEYDELSRLVKEDSLKSASYNLDQVGNNLNGGGVFNELNQLISNNEHLFDYDLNGNLTTKTSKLTAAKFEYAWTVENQLSSVRVFNKNGILSHTLSFIYDGKGRRIARNVENHLDVSKSYARKYIYDGEHILALLDGNNNFLAGYIYGPGIDDPMGVVTDYNLDGELDVLSFIKDRQNSVRIILNENQDVVQEIFYSAYGETQIVNRGQIKQNTNNIFYYTSRELEPETGDYYYRARYYDPALGRFLSEDPIGIKSQDTNFYRYVFNNPLKYTDPSGKDWRIAVGVAVVVVALYCKEKIEELFKDAWQNDTDKTDKGTTGSESEGNQ